jgi:Pyrroline-5-carboxylate reductase dimerisation
MEAMVDAAVHIGFPRDMALKLVTSTIRGSASYAMKSEDSIGMLRNKVYISLNFVNSVECSAIQRIYSQIFD